MFQKFNIHLKEKYILYEHTGQKGESIKCIKDRVDEIESDRNEDRV